MLGNFKNFTVLFKDLVLSDRIEENFKWKLTYFLFLSIFSKFSILLRSTLEKIIYFKMLSINGHNFIEASREGNIKIVNEFLKTKISDYLIIRESDILAVI